jgi:hypothetical protein
LPSDQAETGGKITSLAALSWHLAHLRRALAALSEPAPHSRTIAGPFTVLADPQLPHWIVTLAPNRTRSAAVLMCLVDMPPS